MSKATGRPIDRTLAISPYFGERRDSQAARITIWAIAAGLTFFLVWASQTPVYEVVSGQGLVRPEGLARQVEHLEGGLVAELRIGEGEHVERGDVLAVLDMGDLKSEKHKLEALAARLETQVARFRDLVRVDLTQVGAEKINDLLQSADPSYAQEVAYRVAQIQTLDTERDIALMRMKSYDARRGKAREELAILNEQMARYEKTKGRQVVSLLTIEDTELSVIRKESEILELGTEIEAQKAAATRAETSKAELVAEYRREAAERLEAQAEELARTRESLVQINDRIARAVLRAPVTGIVKSLTISSDGEVVGPGETLIEIIPDSERVFAEIEVLADRIGGVEVGQEASIKILTHDFTRYGDVLGEVVRISPSSFTKESGETFFRVKLGFTATELHALKGVNGELRRIGPGMTVMADIRAGRRSVLAYLLKPLQVISSRAMTEA
ncbi:HlyD family secretion protein [Rhodovulum sp. P5]|uniref:HlyD family type I secretion periplasmic adaptor subunit n=1 Tax=Rhodovulum sp. P5 TaxID=1564506 RepID=UPI0009C2FC18|nr:HlyD family type I secretion periplasmic adaptor subunit [Rhodovulum sp. P5]ARE40532.1 HlyD family secretion protein [Rhodovulum sp. P5]